MSSYPSLHVLSNILIIIDAVMSKDELNTGSTMEQGTEFFSLNPFEFRRRGPA